LTYVNPIPQYILGYESQGLEWLMAQSVFLSQLNKNQKQKLVEICLTNDELRRKDPLWEEVFTLRDLRVTALVLIGRTMLVARYTPFEKEVNDYEELKFFLDGWRIGRDESIIYEYGKKVPYSYHYMVWGETIIPTLIIIHAKNFIK